MKIKRLTREQKKLWNTLQFVLRFTIFSIPLYLVLWLNLSMLPMQYMVADHATWTLSALSFAVTKDNLILSVGAEKPFLFYIGPDCIGWKSMLCFIALVFASLGVKMKKRILGIVFGIPAIYLGNLARIIIVVLIERSYGLEAALVFHDWLWQAGLMALVLSAWLIWLKWEDIQSFLVSFWEQWKRGKSKQHKHIIKLKEK